METRVTFVFDAHGLSAVQVELMLEKLYVRGAFLQADMNHDGQITGRELDMFESLYHLDNDSLGDYVRLWVQRQGRDRQARHRPQPRPQRGRTGRSLHDPLQVPSRPGAPVGVAVAVFDETCYIRMTPAGERSVSVRGAAAFDVKVMPLIKSTRVPLDPSGPMNPAVTMSDPMEVSLEFSPHRPGPIGPAATGTARDVVVSYGRQEPQSLMERVWAMQQRARDWLADLSTEHDKTHATAAFLLMLLAVFLFGVLHALGLGMARASPPPTSWARAELSATR